MHTVKYLVSNFSLLYILFNSALAYSQQSSNSNSNLVHPKEWKSIKPIPLDPAIEAKIDDILPKLTLEQKVGQVIQADNASITPEEVKKYRLGSVLSGGNSAPGPLPYAETKEWLKLADEFYNASIDTEGVEVAIPCIW